MRNHRVSGAGLAAALAVLALAAAGAASAEESLVYNGSFEEVSRETGRPRGWRTAGRSDIEQRLVSVPDPDRGRVAKLECTHFVGGTPDTHVMLAQMDRVGVRRGRWYRLSLWARADRLESHSVDVGLSNTRTWSRVGLSGSFSPSARWDQFEFLFRATADLEPDDSRLQIWFKSTGTLWLDDVKLVELEDFHRRWHPALSLDGVTNALPNSSFECGGQRWGCWAPGMPGWGTQIFRLMGEWDDENPRHGRRCWKLSLRSDELPVAYFDYYEPVEQPVRALLLGHEGWVEVEPGRPCVFSAWVRADRPGLPVTVSVREAGGGRHRRSFSAGTEWRRVELGFTPGRHYACGLVGMDLREEERAAGTLWVDAVQFECGKSASAYRPRSTLEACPTTGRVGNVFTRPEDGLTFRLRAFNDGPRADTVAGSLTLTDFRDRQVWRATPRIEVPPGRSDGVEYSGIAAGRRGFFRLRWEPEDGPADELRCAVIEPCPGNDSPFGMNHAFGWDFLLRLSHRAGVRWWRDWSVKWDTVQPEDDGFDFSVPDAQIDRVLEAGGRVLVLLPFPSALWATTPDMENVKAQAGDSSYLRHRLQVACKPDDLERFADYVRATVEHYRGRVDTYEMLNEPLFTTYSLPAGFGYSMQDYLDMLQVARRAARRADPDCTVVGGVSAPPNTQWVGRFFEEDGLAWCDVTNYHLYPGAGWPEGHESALDERQRLMQKHGPTRPIWVTEFGLYADDDPPSTPYGAGDATMNRAMRRSELAAASDLVRFAAVFCAHGVRKIFYHAGTCAGLHRSSAGNVFFEYGGEPRKQYAAQAALSNLLGPDFEFVRTWKEPEFVTGYEFRSGGRNVAILWTRRADVPPLPVPDGYRALDLMGNEIPGQRLEIDDVPIYLVTGTD